VNALLGEINSLIEGRSNRTGIDSSMSSWERSKTAARLSTKGLNNMPMDEYDKDFTFVIGGFGHSCVQFVADFTSPKLSRLHSIDSTTSGLYLSIDDPHSTFTRIVKLGFIE
jgi:hypothetical protein